MGRIIQSWNGPEGANGDGKREYKKKLEIGRESGMDNGRERYSILMAWS